MNRFVLTILVVILANLRPALATEAERAAPAGMEWWRLRSTEALAAQVLATDVLTTGATSAGPARKPAASEIPEARRTVRVVYPGLVGNR